MQSQIGYGTIFVVSLLKGKKHFIEDENVIFDRKNAHLEGEGMASGGFSQEDLKECEESFSDLKQIITC